MNDFTFTPTQAERPELDIPYFEDARADYAPYYASSKNVMTAKSELAQALALLGGIIIAFQEGKFGTGRKARHGYQIYYEYNGAKGRFAVAGLPMRAAETERKVEQVRTQALLNAADWWRSTITQQVFSPGTDPLMMNLLVDGERTVVEYMRETGSFPRLSAGDVVDGEFEETR